VAHDSCEGRLDHVMANIDTLFQAPCLTSIPLYLVSGESLSCLLRPGRNVIDVNDERRGVWCSLVPVGRPCPRVTTTGLKYNVSKYRSVYYLHLIYWCCYCSQFFYTASFGQFFLENFFLDLASVLLDNRSITRTTLNGRLHSRTPVL